MTKPGALAPDERERLIAWAAEEGEARFSEWRNNMRKIVKLLRTPTPVTAGWLLQASAVNALQQRDIVETVALCRHAHYVNLLIRVNGKDVTREADWVKHLLRAPAPVPGWRLVPEEPTQEMIRAVLPMYDHMITDSEWPFTVNVWRKMLAASPSPADTGGEKK